MRVTGAGGPTWGRSLPRSRAVTRTSTCTPTTEWRRRTLARGTSQAGRSAARSNRGAPGWPRAGPRAAPSALGDVKRAAEAALSGRAAAARGLRRRQRELRRLRVQVRQPPGAGVPLAGQVPDKEPARDVGLIDPSVVVVRRPVAPE